MAQRHEYELVPLNGVSMTQEEFERLLSVESPFRYELIDGVVCDMTGSSPEHADLADNVAALLKEQLGRRGPCRVYEDQYVSIPDAPAVVPDVVMTCDVGDRDKDKRLKPFKIRSPLIVVEVLSPSTEAYDRTEKFACYKRCPTLEVYILVSQKELHVEVYRRARDWQHEHFRQEQTIKLDQLDLELPLIRIYEGVF